MTRAVRYRRLTRRPYLPRHHREQRLLGAVRLIVATVVPVVAAAATLDRLARIFLLNDPVEAVVVDDLMLLRHLVEQFFHLSVVRHLLRLQAARVVEVGGELRRQALAELRDRRVRLHLADPLELLAPRLGVDVLPGQLAAHQVDPGVGEGLQVVTHRLLAAAVRVQTRVARGPDHAVRHVEVRMGGERAHVFLRQTEIDHVNLVLRAFAPDQEVVGFDIAVDQVLRVNESNDSEHLLHQHQNGLQRKVVLAVGEDVLQVRAQVLDDECVKVRLANPEPEDARYAGSPLQLRVRVAFAQQLLVGAVGALQLHYDFLVGLHQPAEVDVAKRAVVDLVQYASLHTPPDHLIARRYFPLHADGGARGRSRGRSRRRLGERHRVMLHQLTALQHDDEPERRRLTPYSNTSKDHVM